MQKDWFRPYLSPDPVSCYFSHLDNIQLMAMAGTSGKREEGIRAPLILTRGSRRSREKAGAKKKLRPGRQVTYPMFRTGLLQRKNASPDSKGPHMREMERRNS